MTAVRYLNNIDKYWVWENGKVCYCTLEEVLYLLSTEETK